MDFKKCEFCGDEMGLPCWNCGKSTCHDCAKEDPMATPEEPDWVCPECRPKLQTQEDDRLKIEFMNESGAVTETIMGPTYKERKIKHNNGECDMFCGFCYSEAMLFYA